MMPDKVYVVCRDYFEDWHKEPVAVFADKDDAEKFIEKQDHPILYSWFEVPYNP